jgi:putative DNA methylase
MPFDYIRDEGKAGRLGVRLMAIVADSGRGRIYLAPTEEMASVAVAASPDWSPDFELPSNPFSVRPPLYGLNTHADLFTRRQLVALTTFSDLIGEAMQRVRRDALAADLRDDPAPLRDGGTGATAYAEAVEMFLGIALSRLADIQNSLCGWENTKTQVRHLFTRQAIPMLWDFGENNVFGGAAGDYLVSLENMAKSLQCLPSASVGYAAQYDAQSQTTSIDKLVSTDPPYYNNVDYADLSDFFYVWLRRSLSAVFPDLFATVATPKAKELVATPYRHGGKEKAETFFLDGMTNTMHRLAEQTHPAFPVSIYYAFKQSETGDTGGTTSTGWETFLDAVIRAGFAISGTWPIRTESAIRMMGQTMNALASSIVLVCRPRAADAPTATRREFVAALQRELPEALRHLQAGNIAPVDLAQAAIGPGMAVFTRYTKVMDAAGNPLSVRQALALINEILDIVLAEQEGDFDPDTRWAVAWFEHQGFAEGEYGVAETLSKAKNTSIAGMVEAEILSSKRGRVRLLKPVELPADWDPADDPRVSAWEMVHQLIRALEAGGESAAASLLSKLGRKAEIARELAYRLYTIAERKKRAAEALSYNALVQSWPEISRLARAEATTAEPAQSALL